MSHIQVQPRNNLDYAAISYPENMLWLYVLFLFVEKKHLIWFT
jgi:hypothetical protein